MKLLNLLSVAALVGSATATPVLEERGGGHHKQICYKRYYKWNNGYTKVCCSSNRYNHHRKSCHSEKKCWYDPWDCRWECTTESNWDWDNDCPKYYVYRKKDHQQRYSYYGGGSKEHHKRYDDDCKRGHYSDYTKGGKWRKHH